MPKRQRVPDVPTDSEAGFGAGETTQSRNLEETAASAAREAIPMAAICEKCQQPALPDPRGTHECARCRSKPVQSWADRRERERAAERKRRIEGERGRP